MAPPYTSIIIFLSLILPASSLTLFFLEGQITCNLNRPFTYQIQVVEEDYVQSDAISYASFVNSPTSPSHYNITALATNDGWNDYYFEIAYEVYHNCHESGQHMYWHEIVSNFWIYSGTHYHTHNFDLTNKGVPYAW